MRSLLLLVMLAAAGATSAHADTRVPSDVLQRELHPVSIWPGVPYAVIPPAADYVATVRCWRAGTCYEANPSEAIRATGSLPVGLAIGKAGWMIAQVELDKAIRKSRHPRRVWILRGASAVLQFALAHHAWKAGTHPRAEAR